MHPSSAGQLACGRDPVRSGRGTVEQASTRRRAGSRTVASPRDCNSGAAPSALHAAAKMPSPSITTGTIASAISCRTPATVASSRPSPGPTTRDPKRFRSSSTSAANPATGMGRWMISLRACGSTPGTRQRDQPGARIAPRPPRTAGRHRACRHCLPRCAPRPSTCGHRSPGAATSRRRRRASTRNWSALDTSSPMSTTSTSPARRARHRTEPRLERLERDGAIGRQHTLAGVARRVRRARSGCRRPAPAAVDRRCRRRSGAFQSPRNPVPNAASITRSHGGKHRWTRRRVEHTNPAPRVVARYSPAVRPSAPLLPGPGDDVDRAAVGAAEHRQRRHAPSLGRRVDQFLDGFGRAASIAPHLLRCDDRDHRAES